MMAAVVNERDRSPPAEKRIDYPALAPAAAALCYPFLLRAFHAVVGAPAVTPSPLAIFGAAVVLAVAFIASGLRVVLIAHGVAPRHADRLWGVGVALSAIVAAAIIAGMCGVRIGALAS
jgi:hypothetical protein